MNLVSPSLETLAANYRNTEEHNDQLHRQMTEAAWAESTLAEHRHHVEEHQLGFGDPAFHALWLRVLDAAGRRFPIVRALEIGVFKGQVISLWALIGRHWNIPVEISAITPLIGDPQPEFGVWEKIRYRVDRRFRERINSGNYYPEADYENAIRTLFARFDLRCDAVQLKKGLSTDAGILAELSNSSFHIVYIDGDHTYKGAAADVRTFAPKVVPGGWLVMDDAAHDIPGTVFFKGYESVTRACALLAGYGFENVLNVGHNRVYEKQR